MKGMIMSHIGPIHKKIINDDTNITIYIGLNQKMLLALYKHSMYLTVKLAYTTLIKPQLTV